MICQECKERPATLHYSKVINGEKTEYHLCDKCAHETGNKYLFSGLNGYSVNDLLAGLFKGNTESYEANKRPSSTQDELQCERCKMTYTQFTKIGKFGCSHCYQSFQNQLKPILKRIHSGNLVHGGKFPSRAGGTLAIKRELKDLKTILQSHIEHEEFEKAIEVRDAIRKLESELQLLQERGTN